MSVGDPVPSIAEADATGEIAELYADIRTALGMSFVNLVWRHLAVDPNALRWTWDTMKPLYLNGAIHAQADKLRTAQRLPTVSRLSTAALRCVGIGPDDEDAIRATLFGYDRGNPRNLVAFCAVLARLDGRIAPACPTPQPARPDPVTPLPELLDLDQLAPHVAAMAREVGMIGARGAGRDIQVSLPRHLARWPGFLALYSAALQPLHDDGSLFAAIDAVLEDGRRRGTAVSGALGCTDSPATDTAATIRAALENLIPHAMGRMIPVVSLLLRLMPSEN